MKNKDLYYLKILNTEYSKRCRTNSSYSLRAFARDLGIDSSNLSSILKSQRKFPSKRAKVVAKKLKLSPLEEGQFLTSVINHKLGLKQPKLSSINAKILSEDIHYNIITEWEYLAILNLVKLDNFNENPSWIADKIGITKQKASIVLKNLIDEKLLQYKKGKLVRTTQNIQTSEDKHSQALQNAHIDRLALAKNKLKNTDVQERDFSSIVISGKKNKLPLVKAMIREFQDRIAEILDEDEKDEVFQMSIQIFPLTTNNSSKRMYQCINIL